MIQGVLTAMVTPFRDGDVDLDTLRENVAWQIDQGVDGLVPCGTTGESPTLSHEEHRSVIETVIEETRRIAGDKVKVVAGTGSNSTEEALELTVFAAEAGADAALMVNPYYNKPTQEGLYRHFMRIAEGVDLPIVLYNIPGRTGITMSANTVSRLATHANIAAIKEATGSLDLAAEILSLCDLSLVSGDDSLTLPLMSIGGSGVISVLSNLLPAKVKQLVDHAANGEFTQSRQMHYELFPLFKAMFLETNPIPIKTAMRLTGKDSGEVRLPLCEMAEENCASLERVMHEHELI